MPAHDLRGEIDARRIGVEELTALYLRRIEKYQGRLKAVAEIDETALAQARALDNQKEDRRLPLRGLPVLIKDNIDVQGLHTTAGSVALADHVARVDAPIVARLRQSGAVILGKTNMTEFANYAADGMPAGFPRAAGR